MLDADLLTFAFIPGILAAFNPCGFAMLPTYLVFFIGASTDEETNRAKNLFRGLTVGLILAVAFLLFFGAIGAISSNFVSSGTIEKQLQWATFILGILMVPLGFYMVSGHEISLRLPRLDKGGKSRSTVSIFLFGISFAIVSLGCTAPVFFAAVVSSFSSDGIISGISSYVAYGAGLSVVVLTLTVAMAMARTEIAVLMRKVLPHIGRISGIFLIGAGIFLAFYGWWEIQVQRGNFESNWLVDTSQEFQSSIGNWINEVGATRLAVAAMLIVVALVVWGATLDLARNIRAAWGAGLAATWLALEIFRYDWELYILPVYRTIIDIPFRLWGWVSDPLRWSVPFEVGLSLFLLLILVLRIRYSRNQAYESAAELQDEEADKSNQGSASEEVKVEAASPASS